MPFPSTFRWRPPPASIGPVLVLTLLLSAGPIWKHSGVQLGLAYLAPGKPQPAWHTSTMRKRPRGPLVDIGRKFAVACQRTAPLWCALWAAWASRPLLVRLTEGVAVLPLMACLQSHHTNGALGIYVGVFLIFWAPLSAVRWWWGWRLHHPAQKTDPKESPWRMNLTGMLWVTLLFAVAAAALRGALPIDRIVFSETPQRLWKWVTNPAAWQYDVPLLLPVLGAVLLLLGKKRRWFVALLILLASTVLAPVLAYYFLITRGPGNPSIAQAWNQLPALLPTFAQMGLAYLLAGALQALLMRRAGYRVTREAPQATPTRE